MNRLIVIFALLATMLYVGCKEGEGDRCQVNDDCKSGLCNMASGTCVSPGQNMGDIDAAVPDGGPIDAAIDAMPDAPPN